MVLFETSNKIEVFFTWLPINTLPKIDMDVFNPWEKKREMHDPPR